MTGTQRVLHLMSHRVNQLVSSRWNKQMPIWLVCEFPKSGGSWFGRMVAQCLELPFCEFSLLPLSMSCVTFSHWPFHPKRQRCFYVLRDGRDVLVSLYYHQLRIIQNHPGSSSAKRLCKRYPSLNTVQIGESNARDGFLRFAESVLSDKSSGRFDWSSHVSAWVDSNPSRVHVVRYEELLSDTCDVLEQCMDFAGYSCSEKRLKHIVEAYSFCAMTGRDPGDENVHSFQRKGIVGDWMNHFTTHIACLFDQAHGELLIDLGYEHNRDWIDRLNA